MQTIWLRVFGYGIFSYGFQPQQSTDVRAQLLVCK